MAFSTREQIVARLQQISKELVAKLAEHPPGSVGALARETDELVELLRQWDNGVLRAAQQVEQRLNATRLPSMPGGQSALRRVVSHDSARVTPVQTTRSSGAGAEADSTVVGNTISTTTEISTDSADDASVNEAALCGLGDLARFLLSYVRRHSAGPLALAGKTNRYVEQPDNWWAVTVQPRAGNLALSLRGTVEHLDPDGKLAVRDDRGH